MLRWRFRCRWYNDTFLYWKYTTHHIIHHWRFTWGMLAGWEKHWWNVSSVNESYSTHIQYIYIYIKFPCTCFGLQASVQNVVAFKPLSRSDITQRPMMLAEAIQFISWQALRGWGHTFWRRFVLHFGKFRIIFEIML